MNLHVTWQGTEVKPGGCERAVRGNSIIKATSRSFMYSIPELSEDEERSEDNSTIPPAASIFDVFVTESESLPRVKKTVRKKANKETLGKRMSLIGEKQEDENEEDCELNPREESDADATLPLAGSIFDIPSSESENLSTNSKSRGRPRVKKTVRKKTKKETPAKRLSLNGEKEEDENEEDCELNPRSNRGTALQNISNKTVPEKRAKADDDDQPKTTRKKGAKKNIKESSVEPENSNQGVYTRLRKRMNSEVQTEKENAPPNNGHVGTQVNPRMLPPTRKTKKNPTKKANKIQGSTETSSSSYYPPSSTLGPIYPITTESSGSIPLQLNNTMENIPSLSDDVVPLGGCSSPLPINFDIEEEDGVPGVHTTAEDAQPAISKPASSSSISSSDQQPTANDVVIKLGSGVSIELSSSMLKNGGTIMIKPEGQNKSTSSAPSKVSFGTLGKLSGRQRRMTSWSSSESCGSSTSTSSESDSSSNSPPRTIHSKRTCRRCQKCSYCCKCR